MATVLTPLGAVHAYGIHLESPAGLWGGDRRDQARTILADAARSEGSAIVAGDFNSRGEASEIARGPFLWATRDVGHTAGPFSFDHILARGLCSAGTVAAGKVKHDGDASDPDPVWAVLAPCAAGPASARP